MTNPAISSASSIKELSDTDDLADRATSSTELGFHFVVRTRIRPEERGE